MSVHRRNAGAIATVILFWVATEAAAETDVQQRLQQHPEREPTVREATPLWKSDPSAFERFVMQSLSGPCIVKAASEDGITFETPPDYEEIPKENASCRLGFDVNYNIFFLEGLGGKLEGTFSLGEGGTMILADTLGIVRMHKQEDLPTFPYVSLVLPGFVRFHPGDDSEGFHLTLRSVPNTFQVTSTQWESHTKITARIVFSLPKEERRMSLFIRPTPWYCVRVHVRLTSIDIGSGEFLTFGPNGRSLPPLAHVTIPGPTTFAELSLSSAQGRGMMVYYYRNDTDGVKGYFSVSHYCTH